MPFRSRKKQRRRIRRMKERANWAELLMEFALYKLAYSQFPPSNLSNTTLKMPSIFLYIYILRNCLRRSHDKVLNLQIWRTGSQKLNGPDLLANQVLGDATCAVWNGPDLTSSMGEVHVGNMWAVFGPCLASTISTSYGPHQMTSFAS